MNIAEVSRAMGAMDRLMPGIQDRGGSILWYFDEAGAGLSIPEEG
jgi:hypothetical protein